MQEMNENSRMIIHSSENKGNKKIKIILIAIFAIIILVFAIMYFCKIPIIKYQGQSDKRKRQIYETVWCVW